MLSKKPSALKKVALVWVSITKVPMMGSDGARLSSDGARLGTDGARSGTDGALLGTGNTL